MIAPYEPRRASTGEIVSCIYRRNEEGMNPCCKTTLMLEMYRRRDEGEEIHVENDVIKCSTCNSEMICDPSLNDQRLRWRWKGDGNG